MNKTIQAPVNHYDVAAWNEYYAQNPGLHRSVGADGADEIDLEDPKVKTAIATAVEAATASLKTNSETLLTEKRDLQTKLKAFDGIDIEGLRKMQDKLQNDDEARLLAEGKVDEVIATRTERMRTDLTTKFDASQTNLANTTEERDAAIGLYQKERIGNEIRRAAEKSGVMPEAIDDVITRSNGVFSIGEEGKIEARTVDGVLIMGADGTKPMDVAEFVESLKETASYYWPGSSSGGAGGSNGGKGGGDISSQMQAAIARGDMKSYRKLRAKMKSGG